MTVAALSSSSSPAHISVLPSPVPWSRGSIDLFVVILSLVGIPSVPIAGVFLRLHLFEGLWPILDKIFTLNGVAAAD